METVQSIGNETHSTAWQLVWLHHLCNNNHRQYCCLRDLEPKSCAHEYNYVVRFPIQPVKNTCNYIHVHSNINANNCIIYIPIGGCETPLQTLTKTIIVKWKNIRCLCHLIRVSGAAAVGTEHRMEEVHTLQT